jgi:hypothetical protein
MPRNPNNIFRALFIPYRKPKIQQKRLKISLSRNLPAHPFNRKSGCTIPYPAPTAAKNIVEKETMTSESLASAIRGMGINAKCAFSILR